MRRLAMPRQSGFTLIECMIAAIILVVALFSISGLQMTATKVEFDAYQRSQALVLAEDMINRINGNRANVAQYVTGTAAPLGTGDDLPADCSGSGAELDRCEWSNLIKGSSVTSGDQRQPGIRNAVGCVVASSTPREYFVVIAWQSQSETSSSLANACGSGRYANDGYRRVLVRVVRIGNLSNLVIS